VDIGTPELSFSRSRELQNLRMRLRAPAEVKRHSPAQSPEVRNEIASKEGAEVEGFQ
jgi:hypothetical protein